jgi:hypothetical protein
MWKACELLRVSLDSTDITMSHDRTNTRRSATRLLAAVAALSLLGLGACGDDSPETPQQNGGSEAKPQPSPSPGKTSFVSADPEQGDSAGAPGTGAAAGAGAANDSANERGSSQSGGSSRSIEQGDIYQVDRNSDRILNLNHYRGLQIVDVSNPSQPEIVGRARVSGDPVEMYQIGDRVYALLNSWRGYYDNQSFLPNRYEGGVVLSIDVSNPKDPEITGRAKVSGRIEESRLTRGGGQQALFVAATGQSSQSSGSSSSSGSAGAPARGAAVARPGGDTTYVESFDVSKGGELQSVSTLELDGRVQDIQGAEEHLMVARRRTGNKSTVSIVDISDPSGQMKEGDQVKVKGRVENKHNMDLEGDVLRVVSGADRNDNDANHVETFDASDIDNLKPIDHDAFGQGQNLYATLFMENRAFFVTYLRQDPFHAFEITDKGKVTEKSEFVVSGWNDFFVPVSEGERLIGIGKNDQQGETVAVSLYDITDLTNPKPLIDREEVELEYSRSEANRDDRAFTVLEDATSVKTQNGTTETGVVLVPFRGWNQSRNKHVSGVKIFTFSDDTLTRRGTMEHGTPVRRSFVADRQNKTTANLSEAELSFFDTSNPKKPKEKGRVELAPNYERFWHFGQYGVRRNVRHSYYYWYHRNQQTKTDRLEVVPLSDDPDMAEPVAKMSVPASARIYRAGSHLVAATVVNQTQKKTNDGGQKIVYETELRVWDVSNPTSPKLEKTLTTDALGGRRYGYGAGGASAGARPEPGVGASVARRPGYYRPSLEVASLGDALVFADSIPERKHLGTRHVEYRRVKHSASRYGRCRQEMRGGQSNQSCTYYTGGTYCTWLERKDGSTTQKRCRNALRKCTVKASSDEQNCKQVDAASAPTRQETDSRKAWDTWTHYEFHALDLRDSSSVRLVGPHTMPTSERDIDLLTRGDNLYVTHRERYDKSNDPRPYVKYYFKRIDFSDPTNPETGSSINIPGELLAVDGSTVVTRNYLWGRNRVDTSLHKLKVQNGLARLKASQRFQGRRLESVQLDGKGHVLVHHRETGPIAQPGVVGHSGGQPGQTDVARRGLSQKNRYPKDGSYLSVLSLNKSLDELSKTHLPGWATLRGAHRERALFSVSGGLLVVDLRSPTNPAAQAFFPTRSWPRDLATDGSSLVIPAGRYGIYRFDVTANNLL